MEMRHRCRIWILPRHASLADWQETIWNVFCRTGTIWVVVARSRSRPCRNENWKLQSETTWNRKPENHLLFRFLKQRPIMLQLRTICLIGLTGSGTMCQNLQVWSKTAPMNMTLSQSGYVSYVRALSSNFRHRAWRTLDLPVSGNWFYDQLPCLIIAKEVIVERWKRRTRGRKNTMCGLMMIIISQAVLGLLTPKLLV